ncbi:MAG: DUF4351 domain-containing protein [Calothrix sp. SM1_7_51]|nr:DUF4351 domain-containing protein [Calothrix sp. SM1_7_51]
MRLAPLYQQDREKAIQEGEQRGEQRGTKQGEQRIIIRLLNRRFGEIETLILERVRSLSTDNLEKLAEALLDFSSLSDLEAWLNQEIQ